MTVEKEINLRDYAHIVNKRRGVVVVFFVVFASIFILRALSTVPIYQATTSVIIEKAEPSAQLNTNVYYMPYDPEFYKTQQEIIRSTAVAKRVVNILSLDKTYESYVQSKPKDVSIIQGTVKWLKEIVHLGLTIVGLRESQPKKDDNKALDEAQKIQSIAQQISSGIIIDPVRETRIVNISYKSTNPEFAAKIVNTVAKAYIEESMEMKMSSSRRTIEWMTQKANEERLKIDQSEKQLQTYMRDNDIVTLENKIALVPEKLSELGSQLLIAETKRKELDALYRKVAGLSGSYANAETIPAIVADPSLQAIRTQILTAEQEILDLSKKFGDKHPLMIRAKSELNVLEKKKIQEIQRIVASIKNEYELARSNEESLRHALNETKSEALASNEKFVQYQTLKREAETNRQLYDVLMKKVKEQDVTEQVQAVTVWIIEEARTPTAPILPKKSQAYMMGILGGLLGGIGLAFFFDYLDNTIKSPEEIELKVGVPVVGTVTLLKGKDKAMDKIVIEEPSSLLAENYKAIRTSILLSTPENHPKTLLITSMSASEGKTVTSINLASSIALSQYNTLLVDADLRRPRIHKVFQLDNSKGLSAYLAGASDMSIVQPGPIDNLSFITAGPIPPNPSELLGSNRMHELIRVMSEKFDIILFDSPPLMTVTDSLILSKFLNVTLVVAKAGSTTYDICKRGLKLMSDINANVLGLVVNALDVKKSGYYYYGYYYNYDYSSKDKK